MRLSHPIDELGSERGRHVRQQRLRTALPDRGLYIPIAQLIDEIIQIIGTWQLCTLRIADWRQLVGVMRTALAPPAKPLSKAGTGDADQSNEQGRWEQDPHLSSRPHLAALINDVPLGGEVGQGSNGQACLG